MNTLERSETYRETLALGTKLHAIVAPEGAAGERLRERALELVLNVASGVGAWDADWKLTQFKAATRALADIPALLDLLASMGQVSPERAGTLKQEVEQVRIRITGLKRRALRDEVPEEDACLGTDRGTGCAECVRDDEQNGPGTPIIITGPADEQV